MGCTHSLCDLEGGGSWTLSDTLLHWTIGSQVLLSQDMASRSPGFLQAVLPLPSDCLTLENTSRKSFRLKKSDVRTAVILQLTASACLGAVMGDGGCKDRGRHPDVLSTSQRRCRGVSYCTGSQGCMCTGRHWVFIPWPQDHGRDWVHSWFVNSSLRSYSLQGTLRWDSG